MATRIYFGSGSGTATIAVGFATWTITTNALSVYGTTGSSTGSALTTVTATESSSSSANQLLRQFIFRPANGLATGAISGTIKGQFRCNALNTLVLPGSQIVVKIVNSGGTATWGTLYTFENATATVNWSATGGRNAKFPKGWTATAGDTMTAVTVTATDGMLVVEVGPRVQVGGEAGTWMRFGNPSSTASDLSEDETSTVDNRPWLEFSGDIFAASATVTATATATGTTEQALRTLATTGVGLALAGAVVLPQIPMWAKKPERWAA